MPSEVLLYTVFINDEKYGKRYTKGLFESKGHASVAMTRIAEEYCVNKCGIENFIKEQISDPSLNAKITDGFSLTKENDVLSITKRIPGYVMSFSVVPYATLTILPIYQDTQTLVVPMENGSNKIVEKIIDPAQAAHVARVRTTRNENSETKSGMSPRCEELSRSQEKTVLERLNIDLENFIVSGKLKPASERVLKPIQPAKELSPLSARKQNPLAKAQTIVNDTVSTPENPKTSEIVLESVIVEIQESEIPENYKRAYDL